ncbi:MAG TPA: cytochrome c peroxidase [Kofleriaceae bacterium]
MSRVALLAVMLAACTSGGDDRADFQSLRYDDGAAPADLSNRYGDDATAAALGQKLFFDTRFSGRLLDPDNGALAGSLGPVGTPGLVSCASCHVAADGFVDTRSPGKQISLASQWTHRKAPTLLESAHVAMFNWDGQRDSMWRQSIGVFESFGEANSGRLFVAEQVFKFYRADYETIFGALPPLDDTTRFPAITPELTGCASAAMSTTQQYICHGLPGDGAEYDGLAADDQVAITRVMVNMAKAIAAYQRLLRCGSGSFDKWIDGDDAALTATEKRGAALFVGKAQCAGCHAGPNLTDNQFHNVGLAPKHVAQAFVDDNDGGAEVGLAAALADPLNVKSVFSDGDDGRHEALMPLPTTGAFRTPSLRCAANHPSFMHTGQLRTVAETVEFFNRGGDPSGPYPGVSELVALGLTDDEQADLTAFLSTLQGPGPDAALLADTH